MADLEAYSANSTIYSVVSSLAKSVARTPFHLYRKSATGNPEDRKAVTTKTQAVDVLNANPHFTFQRLLEGTQQHLELTGEAYWLVMYFNGTKLPSMLWPLRPDRIVAIPDPETFIKGYIYLAPGGEKIPLQVEDIIPFINPDPLNPYKGASPVTGLRETLIGEKMAEEYSKNFFKNGAAPGGIVQFPTNLNPEQWTELNERWKEQHKGVANAHRVAFLEGGATWKDRQYTNTDMQFIEWRNFNRELILEAWAFPKSMTGNVNDVNRANAEAGEYVFGKHRLTPRLDLLKSGLNNHYLKLFGSPGKNVEFDYESPVSEDKSAENAERDSKTNAVATLVSAGVSLDDAVSIAGLPPVKQQAAPGGGNDD